MNSSEMWNDASGIAPRRMVTPYHVWMLQRLAAVPEEATNGEAGRGGVTSWLTQFRNGRELLELNDRLEGCRIRKEGARLFSLR